MSDDYKARVIEVASEDIVMDVDGFYVYWPKHPHGFHNEASLRIIADELERRNRPWLEQIERELGP